MEELEKRIRILREELEKAEEAYYSGEKELESDDLYDYKLRELAILEKQNPELITKDSPTQRVGFYSSSEMNIDHEVPMLSLDNAFNSEDIEAYFTICEKANEDIQVEYVLEPKIDGTSISLIYEKGYLKKAISRGDGERGEDLTNKVLYIDKFPIRISGKNIPDRLVVRGEIYITKSDFKNIKEEKSFANPRNYVSGTLRLKESEKLRDKKLRLCVYQVLYPEELGLSKQEEVLEALGKWGFYSHENIAIFKEKKEIYEYIEKFGKHKNDIDIPCDGLVIKVNQLSLLDEIGYTSKFPKWAIAYKYPSLIKESKLLEISTTVGRTGKITYLARVEPIEIEGSTVQYATLHNANYIKDLDLRIGDYVNIYKSGEVVPRIIGFNASKRPENTEPWVFSTLCPSCGYKLEERDNLATQYCNNEDCLEKKYARLAHWCSKEAADIEGLSNKLVIKLNKIGILDKIADIYRIKEYRDKVINADVKIKEKSFNKLVLAIEKSKEREWRYLLFGLGINYIGEECAYHISNKYRSIDELFEASLEDLMIVEGIGEKGAESIFDWLQKNRKVIEELKEFGLFKPSQQIVHVESFILGKKVVITGKLSKPRSEFSKLLVQKYGAIVQNDLNSKTNLLIVGEDGGSKLKKAEEKGIEIMTEHEILNILGES